MSRRSQSEEEGSLSILKGSIQIEKYLKYILCGLVLSGVVGCRSERSPTRVDASLSAGVAEREEQTKPKYLLQCGDVIEIKFLYSPELNERVTVRPDGMISLQLVDEVEVLGLTPSELDKTLTERYTAILKQPEIAVIVREFAGQKVYIGGEVVAPQSIPLVGEMTALQGVMGAGGFRETAHTGSVIIISKGPEDVRAVRRVDLSKAISGEDPGGDVLLEPFDVVYVPKTFIAEANQFVEQYIMKMIPGTLGAGFSYVVYRGKQEGTIETLPAP